MFSHSFPLPVVHAPLCLARVVNLLLVCAALHGGLLDAGPLNYRLVCLLCYAVVLDQY